MKARVFIGASTEGGKVAAGVQTHLDKIAECVIWDQNVFELSNSTLDNLVDQIGAYDFAIFVLSPDDKLLIRGNVQNVARDNVIFEIGLAIGRIGKNRTFVIAADEAADLRIPTDLLGTNIPRFSSNRGDGNWVAAVGPACARIKAAIEELGPIHNRALRDADGSTVTYVAAVCYRIVDGVIEYLLVNSTKSRRIFPKGRIKDGESATTAAMRIAFHEGGVSARPTDADPLVFRYLKEEEGKMYSVAAVLIYAQGAPSKRMEFRDPQWFSSDAAPNVIKDGRTVWDQVQQLARVIDWSLLQIRQRLAPRSQAGVVPYRRQGSEKVEILLVTSRSQGAWIFPKGNIGAGSNPHATAEKEAYEEAGVRGKVGERIGRYNYSRFGASYDVEMFAMEVQEVGDMWPEQHQRERRWFRLKEADNIVEYDHIKQVLLDFRKKSRSDKAK
ncbi:TIR domain-containing protein [Salinarimonas rosea]|uniref:TIR domain-containing protein n=1 Tax=Salinarimonas rosea TaxID=552063 RepID=UPI000694C50B|nr:TIR domain-containing protein [Salinarimonas rosea]